MDRPRAKQEGGDVPSARNPWIDKLRQEDPASTCTGDRREGPSRALSALEEAIFCRGSPATGGGGGGTTKTLPPALWSTLECGW